MHGLHPILTCAQAATYERALLHGDEEKEWAAIKDASAAVGSKLSFFYKSLCQRGMLQDEILLLVGKGHNGADTIEALRHAYYSTLKDWGFSALIILAEPEHQLRPATKRALDNVRSELKEYVQIHEWPSLDQSKFETRNFSFILDGLLGMQFKPPLREPYREIIEWANDLGDQAGVRMAVDLPSGVGDESDAVTFQADYTFATGIAKWPLLKSQNAPSVGRPRYLDIGFFDQPNKALPETKSYVLTERILDPLRKLRPAQTDKRDYGHLLVIGGSINMPGAVLMAAQAALKSGVGLLTLAVPDPLALRLASAIPEAMWAPLPVDREGAIKPDEAITLLRPVMERATAMLMGPGMQTNRETQRFLGRLLRISDLPHVIDASALQTEVVAAATNASGATVITPHAGEFHRLFDQEATAQDDAALRALCQRQRLNLVLKGSVTRISNPDTTAHCLFGGPVLARGGSGDILAGMIGSLLARPQADAFTAACRGVAWHGRAADYLASRYGETAVRTTELLDYLYEVLHDSHE